MKWDSCVECRLTRAEVKLARVEAATQRDWIAEDFLAVDQAYRDGWTHAMARVLESLSQESDSSTA